MAGVNKVILVGNLGKDPEIRTFDNGDKVAQFSVATNETWKDKNGEKQEKTEWHNVVLWRGLAGLSEQFLKKGSKVYIEGKLTHRSYDDKDGNTRYITEVVGRDMVFLDGKPGSYTAPPPPPQGQANEPESNASAAPAAAPDDDLPF